MFMIQILGSLVLSLLGSWMLWKGKKDMDTKLMIWGAILLVGSYFVFSGGNDDKMTKAALNTVLPQDQSISNTPQ